LEKSRPRALYFQNIALVAGGKKRGFAACGDA
jgi:hypothetical protein